MELKVFRAIDVIVARVLGKYECQVQTFLDVGQTVDFADEDRLIDVNLALSPLNAKKGVCAWKDVLVDDRGVDAKGTPAPAVLDAVNGLVQFGVRNGVTNIGPEWPRGASYGTVYLENGYFLDNADYIRSDGYVWPADEYAPNVDIHPYQAMSVAYSMNQANGPRAGRRYLGFHGHVHKVAGTLVYVEIAQQKGNVLTWLDLGDPSRCDTPDLAPYVIDFPGETSLSAKEGSEGAIFLELTYVEGTGMVQMKRPIGEGY